MEKFHTYLRRVTKGITKLKAQDGLLLQVHGSWELIQELLKHDLIDEFRLWTFPVIIGSGKKTFSENSPIKNLTLVKSEISTNGAIMTFYQKNK